MILPFTIGLITGATAYALGHWVATRDDNAWLREYMTKEPPKDEAPKDVPPKMPPRGVDFLAFWGRLLTALSNRDGWTREESYGRSEFEHTSGVSIYVREYFLGTEWSVYVSGNRFELRSHEAEQIRPFLVAWEEQREAKKKQEAQEALKNAFNPPAGKKKAA